MPAVAGDLVAEAVIEGAAVGQAGERVQAREGAQRRLAGLDCSRTAREAMPLRAGTRRPSSGEGSGPSSGSMSAGAAAALTARTESSVAERRWCVVAVARTTTGTHS